MQLPSSLVVHARVSRRKGKGWPARHGPARMGLGHGSARGAPGFCQPPAEGRGLALALLRPGGSSVRAALPSVRTWSPLMRGPGAGQAGQ